MLSANTVAQKPAGRVNPLSLLGQAVLPAFIAEPAWFCAESIALTTHNATRTIMANDRFLFDRTNGIEASGGQVKNRRQQFYYTLQPVISVPPCSPDCTSHL